jgi:hypothetical protein
VVVCVLNLWKGLLPLENLIIIRVVDSVIQVASKSSGEKKSIIFKKGRVGRIGQKKGHFLAKSRIGIDFKENSSFRKR